MVGPRNGSSGMNTKQTDVLPRDHWAATSLYTDQWGRANSSWRWLGFALVTDPNTVIYRTEDQGAFYLFDCNPLPP